MDPGQDIPHQEHAIMETAATMFVGEFVITHNAVLLFLLAV
jgi:hypothetical protein